MISINKMDNKDRRRKNKKRRLVNQCVDSSTLLQQNLSDQYGEDRGMVNRHQCEVTDSKLLLKRPTPVPNNSSGLPTNQTRASTYHLITPMRLQLNNNMHTVLGWKSVISRSQMLQTYSSPSMLVIAQEDGSFKLA